MNQQSNDELYIPDEEMKVPEDTEFSNGTRESKGLHLIIILGVALVLLLLVVSVLYVWDISLQNDDNVVAPVPTRPTESENQEPESANARADVETMNALSPSDQLPAIITDLENTDLDNLDAELQAIDQELQ